MQQGSDIKTSVEALARAVLYEGYALYPYRPSALKNRQRWSFGVLFPKQYCEVVDGTERWEMQTECLVDGHRTSLIAGSVRFLQQAGEEIAERVVDFPRSELGELCDQEREVSFQFPPLEGAVQIRSWLLERNIYKVRIRVENRSAFTVGDRDEALRSALISAQKLLRLEDGKFWPATEPPGFLGTEHAGCENMGAWPVLVGDPEARNILLSAPIILGDFPKVSPESHGDFFDGTEIDEMLSLRIMTMTDLEKEEMRQMDPRVRDLLQRTETCAGRLMELHGVFREDPAGDGEVCAFKIGQRVRLRPKGRADIFDLALEGKEAMVTSIERDFENETYVCVVVDDDPGRDLGLKGEPGHRFFFRTEEIERL